MWFWWMRVFALWALPILQTQTWSAIVTYSTKLRENLQVTRQYEKKQKDKKHNPQIAVQYAASHSFVRKPELNWLMDGFLEAWVYKQAF
jgi:hypothetical protein